MKYGAWNFDGFLENNSRAAVTRGTVHMLWNQKFHLPCLQELATFPVLTLKKPVRVTVPWSFRSILIQSFHLRLGLHCGLLLSGRSTSPLCIHNKSTKKQILATRSSRKIISAVTFRKMRCKGYIALLK
jgi:hypothetical protein